LNNYNVAVVGPHGCGKTVYLASMHHKLYAQSKDAQFFLRSEQNRLLNEKYDQIVNSEEWPASTTEISEWYFRCCVQAENERIYEVLQFTYIDYAGERITDTKQGSILRTELDDRFKQTDTLLAMLDGRRIRALMRGEKEGERFISVELPNILQIMLDRDEPVPIHFIITKWDLLQSDYSFKEVQEYLLTIEGFQQFVQGRKKYPTRLIPVSSIGPGFAELQADGRMLKLPGRIPMPFQVEMPLACVFLDVLQVALQKLAEEEALIGKTNKRLPFLTVLKSVIPVLKMLRKTVRDKYNDKTLVRILAHESVDLLIDYAESWIQGLHEQEAQREERLRRERDTSLKKIKDEETATKHVMKSFEYLRNKLEQDFPESKLFSIE
jgi:GTPase SAR1 family protein